MEGYFDFLTNTNVSFPEMIRSINSEEIALQLFKKFKLVNYKNGKPCECGNRFFIKNVDRASKAGFRWKCVSKAHLITKKFNPLLGSWFEGSNLSFLKHFDLLLHWIFHLKVDFTMLNARASSTTVTKWNKRINEVCRNAMKNPEKIGGPGKIVEVDETFMFTRKYNRGREPRKVWLFGGIERGTSKCFIVQVKNRKRKTLFRLLRKYVAQGTILFTDDFSSYKGVAQALGFADHSIVVHADNFVNPAFPDAHTNGIECAWGKVKRFAEMSGDKRAVDLYIARFLYRKMLVRLYGSRCFGMKLIHVLKDIKNAYK